jgi:hypothetical protein
MIKCKKCKRVTNNNEPTGSIKKYRVWKDKNNTEHKDISKEKKVCLSCSQNLKTTEDNDD